MFSLFKSLFGQQDSNAVAPTQPRSIQNLSRQELALLSLFSKPHCLLPGGVNGRWEKALGRNPDGAVKEFIDRGWIIELPPGNPLWRLSLKEAKEILRSKGLKVSGSLSQLIERLEPIASEIQHLLPPEQSWQKVWQATDLSRPTIEAHLKKELAAKEAAEAAADLAFSSRDFAKVVAIVRAHNQEDIFFAADEAMWGKGGLYDGALRHESRLRHTESVKISPPPFFQTIPKDVLSATVDVCLRAAIWANNPSRIVEKERRQLAHNISNWVANQLTLDDCMVALKKGVNIKVQILGVPDCPLSLTKKDKSYALDKVPSIPLIGCERSPCCGCCYSADIEE